MLLYNAGYYTWIGSVGALDTVRTGRHTVHLATSVEVDRLWAGPCVGGGRSRLLGTLVFTHVRFSRSAHSLRLTVSQSQRVTLTRVTVSHQVTLSRGDDGSCELEHAVPSGAGGAPGYNYMCVHRARRRERAGNLVFNYVVAPSTDRATQITVTRPTHRHTFAAPTEHTAHRYSHDTVESFFQRLDEAAHTLYGEVHAGVSQ